MSAENQPRIEPRTLKGFRDFLPEQALPRERLIETARRVYRSYGFVPIDTPCLEHEEVLTGKGGEESDRQLYRFEDPGGRRVALRFDLTVPLARFAAQHSAALGTPFKRYAIGPVWRGENTQRGRYREFLQCDFDTIGTESPVADVETVLVVHDLLCAIGIERFTIRLNDRRVLNGLLRSRGLLEQSVPVLRALDKLGKAGADAVVAEMVAVAGASEAQARDVLELARLEGTNESKLERMRALLGGDELGALGLQRLSDLLRALSAAGVPAERVALDLSIARGLDYYTGTILETFLDELPTIGSVCSGGRYDDLAGLFTKERLPGIGASLGLDRLLAALEELGRVEKRAATAPLFLAYFEEARLGDYLRLAARLRAAGIGVELYPEPRKLGAQLKHADRRGYRYALIVGESEWQAGRCKLKLLDSKQELDLGLEEAAGEPGLVRTLERLLAGG